MQPQGGKNQRAQDNMKANPRGEKEKSAQENNMKSEQPRGTSAQTEEKGSAGKDMKAEGREDRNGMKAEGRGDRNGNVNAESNGAADGKSQTVGQAGAGAKLSSEQRTRITTVIRDQHVAPVNSVNFSISVGTRVPRDVSFHPLPAEIVTSIRIGADMSSSSSATRSSWWIPGRSRSWLFSTLDPTSRLRLGRAEMPALPHEPAAARGHRPWRSIPNVG